MVSAKMTCKLICDGKALDMPTIADTLLALPLFEPMVQAWGYRPESARLNIFYQQRGWDKGRDKRLKGGREQILDLFPQVSWETSLAGVALTRVFDYEPNIYATDYSHAFHYRQHIRPWSAIFTFEPTWSWERVQWPREWTDDLVEHLVSTAEIVDARFGFAELLVRGGEDPTEGVRSYHTRRWGSDPDPKTIPGLSWISLLPPKVVAALGGLESIRSNGPPRYRLQGLDLSGDSPGALLVQSESPFPPSEVRLAWWEYLQPVIDLDESQD